MYWANGPLAGPRRSVRRHDDMTEIISQVRVNDLPLDEVTPLWLAPILKFLDDRELTLDLEAESNFAIDPLGRLVGFQSRHGTARRQRCRQRAGHGGRQSVESGGAVRRVRVYD